MLVEGSGKKTLVASEERGREGRTTRTVSRPLSKRSRWNWKAASVVGQVLATALMRRNWAICGEIERQRGG